ncbi:MAG: TonB family protein [Bacteroidales bacterium]
MKGNFLTLFLILSGFIGISQDTTYLNSKNQNVSKAEDWETFKIVIQQQSDAIERIYYKSGQIKSLTPFSDYTNHIYHGISREWFENGLLCAEVPYKSGVLDGTLRTFWPSGIPKRIDIYGQGNFIKGICFDSTGIQVDHYAYQTKPEFPGGDIALIQFIAKNAKYPKEAESTGIEGIVYVRIVISKEGKVMEPKVLRSLHPLLDNEALRVIQLLPDWRPGTNDGTPVNVWFIIPIKFKLR